MVSSTVANNVCRAKLTSFTMGTYSSGGAGWILLDISMRVFIGPSCTQSLAWSRLAMGMGADFLGLKLDVLVVTVPWAAEAVRLPRWPGAPECHDLVGRAAGSSFPTCQQMCWFPVGPWGLLSSQSMLPQESYTSGFRNFSSFCLVRDGLPPSPAAGESAQHCRVLHIGLPH